MRSVLAEIALSSMFAFGCNSSTTTETPSKGDVKVRAPGVEVDVNHDKNK